MMEPALSQFRDEINKIKLSVPTIPFISGLTGTYASNEVSNPEYWVKHLRQTVQFSDGIKTLLENGCRLFIEMGPGNALCTLVRHYEAQYDMHPPISTVRHIKEEIDDNAKLMDALGQIWSYGADIDWNSFYSDEQRNRVPLPTYPFEHKRYWIEVKKKEADDLIITQEQGDAEEHIDTDILPIAQVSSLEEACQIVCNVWKELLGLDYISDNESFFDIGGDSVMLIKLHATLQSLFPGVFVITDFFEKVTVKDQGETIFASKADHTVRKEDDEALLSDIVKNIQDGKLDLDEALERIKLNGENDG